MPTEFILSVLMPKMANKSNRIWKFILNAMMLTLCFADFAKADTTAVTTLSTNFVGNITNSMVGFSFTPTTNILVTQVSYRDKSPTTASTVSFWSGTNYIFANFSFPPGSGVDQIVSTNVSLTLLAGQNYTITFEGVSSTAFDIDTGYQIAPELSNYTGKIFSSGAFTDYGTLYYFEGPNFTFVNQAGTISPLDLTIAQASSTNVIVSWPAASAGFILQQIDALESTNWLNNSNAISTISGTNQISDFTISNRFYRLYHP